MANYRNVGTHVVEIQKGETAVMVGPGEFIELSANEAKDDYNKAVMEDFIDADAKEGK